MTAVIHSPVREVRENEMDALIRQELASIYSTTVPEHHSEHRPAPLDELEWERARLSRAARNLRRERPA